MNISRQNWMMILLLSTMIILLMVVFRLSITFDDEIPTVEVVNGTNLLEVSQEFSVLSVETIRIQGVNVNVCVVPSDNRNIRIIYQPSSDEKSFVFHLENRILTLSVDKVENTNDIIVSSGEMVYLYIPKHAHINLINRTETGFLDVSQVPLKNVTASSSTGIISLKEVQVEYQMVCTTNSGKVVIQNCGFMGLDVNTHSGLIALESDASCDAYELSVYSEKGKILINTQEKEPFEDQEKTYANKISIYSVYGDIKLRFFQDFAEKIDTLDQQTLEQEPIHG